MSASLVVTIIEFIKKIIDMYHHVERLFTKLIHQKTWMEDVYAFLYDFRCRLERGDLRRLSSEQQNRIENRLGAIAENAEKAYMIISLYYKNVKSRKPWRRLLAFYNVERTTRELEDIMKGIDREFMFLNADVQVAVVYNANQLRWRFWRRGRQGGARAGRS
ncbi:hypothetical protein VTH06DRAFT_4178 [Thermothelomyces fergusii]